MNEKMYEATCYGLCDYVHKISTRNTNFKFQTLNFDTCTKKS